MWFYIYRFFSADYRYQGIQVQIGKTQEVGHATFYASPKRSLGRETKEKTGQSERIHGNSTRTTPELSEYMDVSVISRKRCGETNIKEIDANLVVRKT